jgi:hypothetical protein
VATHRLLLTPSADEVVKRLRGSPAAGWTRLQGELKSQGCQAGGYRLLGADGELSPYCCRHLVGQWRVICLFEPGTATVIAVGEHDGPAFYRHLATDLGISEAGRRREQKPPCCQ